MVALSALTGAAEHANPVESGGSVGNRVKKQNLKGGLAMRASTSLEELETQS
jgi:hypothetical protein